MIGFEVSLGPLRLGAEVLVQIAQARGTGTLLWSMAGVEVRLVFCEGRAEGAFYGATQEMTEREPVVGVLHGFATTMEGSCQFSPSQCTESRLRIDTLGEVLVALSCGLRNKQLKAIWDARAGYSLEPTSTFERIAAALGQLGGPALKRPLADSTVGTVIAGADETAQRAWATLIAMGALHATEPTTTPSGDEAAEAADADGARSASSRNAVGAPTLNSPQTAKREARGRTGEPSPLAPARDDEPLPDDPQLRDLARDVLAESAKASGTHYEVLGVDPTASSETIRKAYFNQAKRWHSDRFAGTGLSASVIDRAAGMFRRAEEGHRILSDPDERKSYDYVIDRQARGLPTEPKVIFEAENLFRKAETLVRRGQAEAAVPLLREATKLNKGEPDFWTFLGWALYCADGSKALVQAREHIQAGLLLREKNDIAHEFLGRIAHQEGQLADAEHELKLALSMNAKNVEAQRELRLLQMRRSKAKTLAEQKKGLGGLLGKVLKR